MPAQILNPTLYKDRTVQDWHRAMLPDDHWAIDLDLMGACRECRAPLYLIEATTNPNKPLSILRALAQRACVPAFVIYHREGVVTGGRVVEPQYPAFYTEPQLLEMLRRIRATHMESNHLGIVGGVR